MTVTALIKKLSIISKKHGPGTRVCLNIKEVQQIEDYSHWEINCCDVETIRWCVDDNFSLKNGTFTRKWLAGPKMTEKLSGIVCDKCRKFVSFNDDRIKNWHIIVRLAISAKHHYCPECCVEILKQEKK